MLSADTHVHVYPAHDAAVAFHSALDHLARLAGSPANLHRASLLTERTDCDAFGAWSAGRDIPAGFHIAPAHQPGVLLVTRESDGARLHVFAGRQLVTAENLEVLALLCPTRVPERLSTTATLEAVRQAGGIPVLCWAPGKWTGRRGSVVRGILLAWSGEPLLLGDTPMRARGVPEPAPMTLARRRGLPVVAGTDPLPFAGDERITGTYGIVSDAFDPAHPLDSMRDLLLQARFTIAGERNPLPRAATRWLNARKAGRA